MSNNTKKVVIGFSKSTKKLAIGSFLIRWYMKTPYSHVYIKFKAETLDRTLIYEAVGGGVRFIGSKRWEEYAKEVASFELDITDESYYQIMRYCVDNSGTNYGFWQNIGVAISSIFNFNKNPFSNGENCSEAIGEILGLEGHKINKDINLLTPKDIFLILNNDSF